MMSLESNFIHMLKNMESFLSSIFILVADIGKLDDDDAVIIPSDVIQELDSDFYDKHLKGEPELLVVIPPKDVIRSKDRFEKYKDNLFNETIDRRTNQHTGLEEEDVFVEEFIFFGNMSDNDYLRRLVFLHPFEKCF